MAWSNVYTLRLLIRKATVWLAHGIYVYLIEKCVSLKSKLDYHQLQLHG